MPRHAFQTTVPENFLDMVHWYATGTTHFDHGLDGSIIHGTVEGSALLMESWGTDFGDEKPGRQFVLEVKFTNGKRRRVPVKL